MGGRSGLEHVVVQQAVIASGGVVSVHGEVEQGRKLDCAVGGNHCM